MKTYKLKRKQLIRKDLKSVFSFFEKPENLESITPPNLGFKILTPKPIKMQKGALIDYKIKLLGIPVNWTTEITEYNSPKCFVDKQIKGPYSLWEHKHFFEEANDGTYVIDEVTYSIGFGLIGRFMNLIYVKNELDKIFDFRAKIIEQILK